MASPPARPVRSSSVVRSLASAAAALREQERSSGGAPTDIPERGYSVTCPVSLKESTSAFYSASTEQRTTDLYDREILYEELRERQRNQMQRQRLAYEYHVPNGQQTKRPTESENSTAFDNTRSSDRNAETSATFAICLPRNEVSDQSAAVLNAQTKSLFARPVSRVNSSVWPASSTGESNVKPPWNELNAQTTVTVVEGDGESEKKSKKRVRYLREMDRHDIIKRIEKGEKQAALAREFGVTRAAICHIKKNRSEILSRYNSLVQSAQKSDSIESGIVGPPGVEKMVHQVRATSVLLLLTMLRDNRSSGATFRRVAGRLIMIILEETLADLGAESVEVKTDTGHTYRGLELRQKFCGVAIGAEGSPFLVLFHQMEPEAPQGSIHIQMVTDKQGQRLWCLDHMDLPADITQHKVLLFSSSCSSGNAECKAIEALCSVGCNERSITLVVLLVASDGIVNISNRFPQVKIITGGIDSSVNLQTDRIVNGFGDFVMRYNGI